MLGPSAAMFNAGGMENTGLWAGGARFEAPSIALWSEREGQFFNYTLLLKYICQLRI
jgi:hypothetical protein